MTSERESDRHERRLPHAWTRRVLVTAGVVVAGWLLLSGSPAEAAPLVSGDPAGPAGAALTAASAAGAGTTSGAGIVEQAAPRAIGTVHDDGRGDQRFPLLDETATGRPDPGRADGVVDDAVRAVRTQVGRSTRATDVGGLTPSLDAVADTAPPIFESVGEVTTATRGEPGVPSLGDRKIPGSGVEAPRASTESVAAPAGLARRSSRSSSPPHSSGRMFAGPGAGTDAGPDLPHHAFPAPGPSHGILDDLASAASGHGPVDRAQNVSGDTSPLVFAPRLLASLPAASRPTGSRERAVRPSVSPD